MSSDRRRVVALVQARMGSSRFPGKALAPLGGRPLLEWVLRRTAAATTVDQVVLATTTERRDDALVKLAEDVGVAVFRGDEHDVLGRFVAAAGAFAADVVVRVCADNPFVDGREIDRLIEFFGATACDYACNHLDRLGSAYADGFGAEICAADSLRAIARRGPTTAEREHATLFFWNHPDEFVLASVPAPRALAHPELHFDVDTADALARMEALVAAGVEITTPAAAVVRIARALAGDPRVPA